MKLADESWKIKTKSLLRVSGDTSKTIKNKIMEKEIYYIWEDGLTHDFCGMPKKEYDRIIWDAHKIMRFERASGFESLEDVLAYVKAYFKDVEPQIIER